MAALYSLPVVDATDDLYAPGCTVGAGEPWRDIRTHYEQQWLDRGLTIKYLCFGLDGATVLNEPAVDDIPLDTYRSYSRGYIQMPQLMEE